MNLKLSHLENIKILLLPGFDLKTFPYLVVVDFARISIYDINTQKDIRIG